MTPILSRAAQISRWIAVAVILFFQLASLWVAFSLNTTIIRRTDTYAEEAAELASTVISNRIATVQQFLAKLSEDLVGKLEGGAPIEDAHSLLDEYKKLWNYSEMRLFRYDGGIVLNGVRMADREMRLLERAVKEKNIVMGRSSYERSIAYAVPVLHGDTLKGVFLVVRGSVLAEQLLNIDVFGDTGVTILADYGGDILVKTWNTDLATLHEDARFIRDDGTLDTSMFGPDYSVDETGIWRFNDLNGHKWLLSQCTRKELGVTLLYAAPVDLLMAGLPALRWRNLLLHVITFLGTIMLLADVAILQRLYQKKIRSIELTDRLTGGDNTRSFLTKMGRLLADTEVRYALISLDTNKFKLINDKYGVDKANELLRLIHSVLTSSLGQDELCAHHNADTFILLLRYHGEEEMRGRIGGLMKEVMRRKHELGLRHKQGLSAGVYVIDDLTLAPYLMLDHANFAREICKKPPHPSCVFYDSSVQEQHKLEADILNFFSSSLKSGHFELWLQPKVNIRTNMVSGAEALVRWNHPVLGFLSPGVFLPVLEKNARIARLDLWMFREACRLLARWDREGREIVPIAVNLSRFHLQDMDFLTSYLNIMHEYGIDPHWLELELTEDIFVENEDAISRLFAAIRSHGLRCAIDDFGTGYSSLSLLQRAKVDTVKLDRSFFSGEEFTEQGRAVVRSITQLASALGLTCVAEGVENQATLEFLLSTECSTAQGYFYSKPLRVEEFENYAYAADKTCKILSTGFVCYLSDSPSARPAKGTVDIELLSAIPGVGVCVIKKYNHELIFFNDLMKEVTPHITRGMLCHELWTSHCSSCPLMLASRDRACHSITRSDIFGCSVRLTAREVMWDDNIPAYLVTLVPLSSEGEGQALSEDVEKWKKQAREDFLTSFLNRQQFEVEVAQSFAERERGTLFIIDLDGFKQVNDTFGHLMGDEVLKNASKRIRLSFRKDDILSRYGGDEFLVYAPRLADREIIEQRMQTLLGLLRHPHTLDGTFSAVTASIGIASFPADGRDIKELIARADKALYEAKRRGKDQYVFFEDLKNGI